MQLIHTLNRGVDKRRIFLDEQDRFRFIHDLFEFNDKNWVNTSNYRFNSNIDDIASRQIIHEKRPRELLVDILIFCLMPNHYHLLLSPLVENGVPKFMKKLNMGYAKYFNTKYKRSGALFEGRYKQVPITEDAHFIHIPYYIHCNPLDLEHIEWRSRSIKNYESAMQSLNSYRWSSHLDYLGEKNFPSITNRNFLLNFFGNTDQYRKSIENWLREISIEKISHETLE